MKKQALLLLTCTALLMTGCASTTPTTGGTSSSDSSVSSAAPAATAASNDAADTTGDTAAESTAGDTAAESTAAPEAAELKLGKNTTIGDWKICAKKISSPKQIKNGSYRYFQPSKGNSFIVVDMSVRNNGTKGAEFLPRVGLKDQTVLAKLVYADGSDYSPTQLLAYDKDLTTKKIESNKTKNGILVFDIPKKIAKKKKDLKLTFTLDETTVTYSLK